MRKIFAVLAFLLAFLATSVHAQTPGQYSYDPISGVKKGYLAGSKIYSGMLVVRTTASDTVVPVTHGATTGVIGVALNNASTGQYVSVGIMGVFAVSIDGNCTFGYTLTISSTADGNGTCVNGLSATENLGLSLATGAGSVKFDISPVTASPAGPGSGSFAAAGDLSGTSSSQTVVGIRGHSVPAPTTGYLNWNGSAFVWSTSSGFTAGGDLSGTSTSQQVGGILGNALPTLSTGFLNWTGSAWAFSTAGTGNVSAASNFPSAGYKLTASNTTTGTFGSSAFPLDCSSPAFDAADWGLILQNCLAQAKTNNATFGVVDMSGVAKTATTVASVNPFLVSGATFPASGVIIPPAGSWATAIGMVVAGDWSIRSPANRGFAGQVGSTLIPGTGFPTLYNTGTATMGTPGVNEVVTLSGASITSSNVKVGEWFVSPGGSSTTNNTFGCINAVNVGAQTITLQWGANNGTGAPASSTYEIHPDLYAAGCGGASNNGDQFGMILEGVNLDCNVVVGCVPYHDAYGNQGTYPIHVGIHGFLGMGAVFEFQAQNFDKASFNAITPGVGCSTSTIPLVVRLGAESSSGFSQISTNQCAAAVPAIAVDDQTNGLSIDDADLEHMGVGISIGANVTCPYACAMGPKTNVQGGTFKNVHSLAGGTTLFHISNAEGTPKNITIIDAQTTATNMLIDDNTGCTLTAGGSEKTLGVYQTGENGVIVASSAIQAGCQPKAVPLAAVTVANLPAAATSALAEALVSDGVSATDCTTGGGSTLVGCYNNGTTWVAYTGSGSGGSGLSGMTAGQVGVAGSASTITSSVGISGTGNLCAVTSCVMTTPNLGTPSAVNLANATFPASIGLTANPLSQFASTTSAQLAGIISNETGTGLLVFNNNPTLIGATLTGALSGTGAYIPVSLLNSGTGASSSTFWRGDGTWATPSGGSSGISGQTVGCVLLAATATTSTSSASVCDNGTTVSTTEPVSASSFSSTADGTHPSSVQLAGNTTLPTLTTNTVTILGPPSATPTAWSLQVPTALPSNNHLLGCTVSGTNCLLTDEGAIPTGTVTTFSAGNLSPLFTTSVATATSTPALTFALSNAAQNSVFAGPATGGAGAPSFQTAPTISAANMTSFPTFNQSTTGAAAALSVAGQTGLLTFTGITSTNRTKTVRDAADTLLELGGSYTPTGTWTNMTLVTPALGTPSALVLTNATSLPCGALPALTGAIASSAGSCTTSYAIANTTFTNATTAVGGNACSSSSTVTMTGVATTSVFIITNSTDVSGSTGWGSTGGLIIDAWPTANTLNYKICNQTASSITPGAVTWNVAAR